jgi:hypothetical protein
MLKKIGMLLILSIFANAENIEKFNLKDIKKCSDTNKDLLCSNNSEWMTYRNVYSLEDNKVPNCNNKNNELSTNMHIIAENSDFHLKPIITKTEIDKKTIIKQTYENETISIFRIMVCKNKNELIVKTIKK